MVLHSAFADAKIHGDLLAGMTGKDQVHDLALSRTQPRDVVGRVLPPGRQLADQLAPFTKQRLYPGERLAQPDSYGLAFVARGRAEVRALKLGCSETSPRRAATVQESREASPAHGGGSLPGRQ